MFTVQHIINGFYSISLGSFDDIQEAVTAIKEHVVFSSAITNPRYSKSMHGNSVRIDYSAKDCYYLITLHQNKETINDNEDIISHY